MAKGPGEDAVEEGNDFRKILNKFISIVMVNCFLH